MIAQKLDQQLEEQNVNIQIKYKKQGFFTLVVMVDGLKDEFSQLGQSRYFHLQQSLKTVNANLSKIFKERRKIIILWSLSTLGFTL